MAQQKVRVTISKIDGEVMENFLVVVPNSYSSFAYPLHAVAETVKEVVEMDFDVEEA